MKNLSVFLSFCALSWNLKLQGAIKHNPSILTPIRLNPGTIIFNPNIAIDPAKFSPETLVSLPELDEAGKELSRKTISGQTLWSELDVFTQAQIASFRGIAFNPEITSLQTLTIEPKFDAELGTQIETVMIPQDSKTTENLFLQRKLLLSSIPILALKPSPEGKPEKKKIETSLNKSWGNQDSFAASIKANFSSEGAAGQLKSSTRFNASATIFGRSISMLDVDSRMNALDQSASTSVKIIGQVPYTNNGSRLAKNVGYTMSQEFRKRFLIGPVPVSVGATVAGALGADLNYTSNNSSAASGSVRPYTNLSGAADAAIDAWVARAGVEGKVRFLEASAKAGFNLSLDPIAGKIHHSLKVDNKIEALSGEINLYAKVRKFWGGWKKWTKTLFSWNGFSTESVLVNESGTLSI